jgi:hypothetical protein
MSPEQRGNSVTPEQQIAAIAGMQVEVRHLAHSIEGLANDVRGLKEQLGETQQLVDRGRGAWSTLVVVGTAAAAVLTAVTWVIEHFGKVGGKL